MDRRSAVSVSRPSVGWERGTRLYPLLQEVLFLHSMNTCACKIQKKVCSKFYQKLHIDSIFLTYMCMQLEHIQYIPTLYVSIYVYVRTYTCVYVHFQPLKWLLFIYHQIFKEKNQHVNFLFLLIYFFLQSEYFLPTFSNWLV